MILIFGGTTEGRLAVQVMDEAGKPFYYSTKGDAQRVEMVHGIRLTGAMDLSAAKQLCVSNDIHCIVDAAHPFAEVLHDNIASLSMQLNIPVIRWERPAEKRIEGVHYCQDYDEALKKLEERNIRHLLCLSGVNTIKKLAPFWRKHEAWFRILPRKESLQLAEEACFPTHHLIYYHEGDKLPDFREEEALIQATPCDAILTKDSGESGGLLTKVNVALAHGKEVFVIERPPTPSSFLSVSGPYGLRKTIEKLLPGFFPLRTGFTTGACATVAVKAAMTALLHYEPVEEASFALPDGEVMSIPIETVDLSLRSYGIVSASVIKDAGDDPDVTNGMIVKAFCRINLETRDAESETAWSGLVRQAICGELDHVRFYGGEGIGTVTLPGLGIAVGEPAINPVPRQMMVAAIRDLTPAPVDVCICIPGGEERWKRTFNNKVGVIGGLSVIGTSGIVRPLSNEALVESIQRELQVAKATGCQRVILNSGAKSERIIRSHYPDDPPQAFIHYGNFIGDTLRRAGEAGIQEVVIGVMTGKAVKLAAGHLNTHSHQVTMDTVFLHRLAEDAGCSKEALIVIDHLKMARTIWGSLDEDDGKRFQEALKRRCEDVCATVFPRERTTLFIIKEQ